MTDNEKLARWQGWGHIVGVGWCSPNADDSMHEYLDCHDYLNNDAAAMSLLDTLVEKGFTPMVEYARYILPNCWICTICHQSGKEKDMLRAKGITRREAVVAACLEAARKEDV